MEDFSINAKLTPEMIEDLKANTQPLDKCSPEMQEVMCALAFHDPRCLIVDDEEQAIYRASADLEDIVMGKI
jgi:hypothetical protein